jgi:hypothetical protein
MKRIGLVHILRYMAGIFVVGLVLAGCASVASKDRAEVVVTYSKDLQVPPDRLWPDEELKRTFSRYWRLRFAGEVDEAYKLEAPFFQEMTSIGRYRVYVPKLRKDVQSVEVRGLNRKTSHLVTIECLVRMRTAEGELRDVYLEDAWVSVREKWYHVIRDPIFFPDRTRKEVVQ